MKSFFELLNETRKVGRLFEQEEGDKFHVSFDIKFGGPESDLSIYSLFADTFADIFEELIMDRAFTQDEGGVMPPWWGDNKVSNLKVVRKGARKFNVSFDLEFAGSVNRDIGPKGNVKNLIVGELNYLFTDPPSRSWKYPHPGTPWWTKNKISNVKASKIGKARVPGETQQAKTASAEEIEARQKEAVQEALKKGECTQNSDGTWSCKDDIDLSDLNLKRLPVKFKIVGGYFDCSNNQLRTLEGAPRGW